MKSVKKYFIAILGSLILLAAFLYLLLLLILPNIIDVNEYKDQIYSQIEKSTGFKFSAEDIKLKTSFNPFLNLKAHHVKILYPNGDIFLKITDANVKIRVIPILFKKIELNSIELTRPIANLTLYSDCTTSLEKYLKPLQKKNSEDKHNLVLGFKFVPKINAIKMNNYKLSVKDENLYSPFVFEGKRLVLSNLKLDESMQVVTKGVLSSAGTDYLNYDLDIDTFLNKTGDKRFFKVSPFINIKKYSVNGDIYAHLKITKKDEFPLIHGEMKLSNLDFKISNKYLLNNHVKLSFLGDSVDVDASVQTGDKDGATLLGKISYGAKPNVDLEVKALNAQLTNLHELISATLSSLNIKNTMSNYSVSGLADLNFKIKSNFKKIESEGKAKVINANVTCKNSPLKITNINSIIDFSNNTIKINKAKALINLTPIEINGTVNSNAVAQIAITAEELPLNQLYKNFILDNKNIDYIIERGKLTFKASIVGKLSELKINFDSVVSDLFVKNKKNKLTLKSPVVNLKIESNKNIVTSALILLDSSIHSDALKTAVNAKKIAFDINSKSIVIKPATVYLDGSPLQVQGEVKDYSSKLQYDLSFKGKLSSQELYNKIKGAYPLMASTKGYLPVVGNLSGTQDNLKFNAQLMANSTNYISCIVVKELLYKPSILNISINFKNDITELSDLSLYKIRSNIDLDKNLNINILGAQKLANLSGNIKDFKNIYLDGFKVNIPNPLTVSISNLKSSEISLKTDMLINGRLKSPDLKGNLYISRLLVPDYNIRANDLSFTFDKDDIQFKTPEFYIKNSAFDIAGNIVPNFDKNIIVKDVKLISSNFDLTSLAGSFSPMLGREIYPGLNVPVKIINGNAYIENFKIADVVAKRINSKFELNDNILKVSNMYGEAYNGKIWGNINYNFLQALTSIKMAGKSLDAAPAVYVLTGINDNIKGKLDFKINTSTYGYTRNQHLKSLSGQSEIYVSNGQLGTLGKFEHFLYAQNLMSQSIMKSTVNVVVQALASKNTGRLKYLDMNVSFSDGYANVESLKFSGPNMSMSATGKLNMLNNWADFEILGKVSSDVVSNLGPFGDLSLSNIVSNIPKLNNMPLPNIFYKNYNLQVTQDVLNTIPDLTPKTDLKTKNFMVKIHGNVESVKSVKLFKWISLKSVEQNIETKPPEVETKVTPEPAAKKIYNVVNHLNMPKLAPAPAVYHPAPQQAPLPNFLDNLPDNFK